MSLYTHSRLEASSKTSPTSLIDKWTDKALEYGIFGNKITQTIFKIYIFGDKRCCYHSSVISESSFVDHTVSYHGLKQNTAVFFCFLLFLQIKLHFSKLCYLSVYYFRIPSLLCTYLLQVKQKYCYCYYMQSTV